MYNVFCAENLSYVDSSRIDRYNLKEIRNLQIHWNTDKLCLSSSNIRKLIIVVDDVLVISVPNVMMVAVAMSVGMPSVIAATTTVVSTSVSTVTWSIVVVIIGGGRCGNSR